MKTRTDFVSNSSSCSFIVNDPIDMTTKINAAFTKSALNDINTEFEVSVTGSKKAVESFKAALEAQGVDLRARDVQVWPDNTYYYYNTAPFSTIVSVDFSTVGKLDRFDIGCDDYEYESMVWLGVIYRMLKNINVSVDDSESERAILFNDEDSYKSGISKLFKIAFQN